MGDAWDDTLDLVFPNIVGKLMNPANLMHRSFYPLLKKADLPQIRFHDLRHTAATLLIKHGVNIKVVSEMLGHADVATTMRIYAHVMPHMQEAAASMMDSVFPLLSDRERGQENRAASPVTTIER